MGTPADLKKMKVSELREQLAQRGLDTKGVKEELVARLSASLEQDGGEEEAEGQVNNKDRDAIDDDDVLADIDAVDDDAAQDEDDIVAAEEDLNVSMDDLLIWVGSRQLPPRHIDPPTHAHPLSSSFCSQVSNPRDEEQLDVVPTDAAAVRPGGGAAAPAAGDGVKEVDAKDELERRKKRAERFGLPVPVDTEEASQGWGNGPTTIARGKGGKEIRKELSGRGEK
jgi:hypothetical protein